jgi:hypothetical protein
MNDKSKATEPKKPDGLNEMSEEEREEELSRRAFFRKTYSSAVAGLLLGISAVSGFGGCDDDYYDYYSNSYSDSYYSDYYSDYYNYSDYYVYYSNYYAFTT